MNLHDALQSEHSKAQTLKITVYIGGSRKRFGELIEILVGDDRKLAQRAAWVVSHCAEANPSAVQPYLRVLLENLERPNLHDAIKRNTMKGVAALKLPDDLAGLAAGIAFDLLGSPTEAVATKVYAMSVLEPLCQREPVLADELRLHIEHQLSASSPAAFRVRSRDVLKRLDRSTSS